MTHLEAIERLEEELTALDLIIFGEKAIGMEALGPIARHFGHAWAELENGFEDGSITPSDYAEMAVRFVREYKKNRFMNKLDKAFGGDFFLS